MIKEFVKCDAGADIPCIGYDCDDYWLWCVLPVGHVGDHRCEIGVRIAGMEALVTATVEWHKTPSGKVE